MNKVKCFMLSHRKLLGFLLVMLLSSAGVFAKELESNDMAWIDQPVFSAMAYFEGMVGTWWNFASHLAFIVGLIGFTWECIQLLWGTSEVKKFFVGNIMKWFMFSMLMTFFPAITRTVQVVAIQAGVDAGAPAIKLAESNITGLLENVEDILKHEKSEILRDGLKDAAINTGISAASGAAIWAGTAMISSGVLAPVGLAVIGTGLVVGVVSNIYHSNKHAHTVRQLANLEKSGYAKKKESLLRILGTVDENGDINTKETKSKKYFLDLYATDDQGKKSSILSPAAMFKITLFNAQLLWENSFSSGFENIQDEKGEVAVDRSEETTTEAQKKGGFLNKWKTTTLLEMGIEKIGYFFMKIILILFMLFTMAACIIQYIMGICEYTIISVVGIILIPFLLFDGTKDIPQKLISTILNQAVKLAMITMMMTFTIYVQTTLSIRLLSNSGNFNLSVMAYFLFSLLLCYILCAHAPQLAQALLSGQPQLSMGEFVRSAGAAVAFGTGAAHIATSGLSTMSRAGQEAVRDSYGLMRNHDAKQAAKKGAMQGVLDAGGSMEDAKAAGKDAVKANRQGRYAQNFENLMRGGSGSGGSGGFGGGMYNSGYVGGKADADNNWNKENNLPANYGAVDWRNAVNENGTNMTRKEHEAAMEKMNREKYKDLYNGYKKKPLPKKSGNFSATPPEALERNQKFKDYLQGKIQLSDEYLRGRKN